MTDEPATGVSPRPPREDRPPIDLVAALKLAGLTDAICLGGILLSIVLGYVTLPLATVLIRHVVTHLLVTGSITALLTGGALVFDGHLNFVAALAAGIVGICKFDPFFFWAGRRYGEHVGHFLETYGGVRPRTVARLERWVARFGLPLLTASYFLPIPTWIVMLLLGASGVRWRWFLLFDLLGSAAWCTTFLVIGHHFHTEVNHIAHLVTHYSRISTIVLIAVVVVFSLVRSSRQQRSRPAR